MSMQLKRYLKHGVAFDPEPDRVPEDKWHDCGGVVFSEGAALPAHDQRYIWVDSGFNAGASYYLYHLQYAPSNSLTHWWLAGWGGAGQAPIIKKFQGTSTLGLTDITDAAWAALGTVPRVNAWTGGNLNGTAIINAGWTHTPVYYNTTAGGATTTVLPGWVATDRCRAMRPYKYHLVAMNMTEAGVHFLFKLKWSSAAAYGAVPATWVPAAANEAGDNQLSDTLGQIIDGAKLGEVFFIYKRQAIYRMTYVGGPTVMAFEPISRYAGALTQNCVVDVGEALLSVTGGDIVLVDETGQVRSIADQLVRNYLIDNQAEGTQNDTFVTWNPCRKQAWVVFPEVNQTLPGRALVWDMPSGDWSLVELPVRVTGAGIGPASQLTSNQVPPHERAVFMSSVTASPYNIFLSQNDPLATTSSYVGVAGALRARRIDLGDPTRRKLISGLRLIGEFPAGWVISVDPYTSATRDGVLTPLSTQTFTGGNTDRIPLRADGRFFEFEFRWNAQGSREPFRMAGFEVEYEMRGRW